MTPINSLTSKKIAALLAQEPEQPIFSPYPDGFLQGSQRRAAILIPFLRNHGEWHLLFIRRSTNDHDRHRGQVAFPGGGMEPEDHTVQDAALREAGEETGLPRSKVRILGDLKDFVSVTNYRVTPVVAEMDWPVDLVPDPTEVARIFTIPLSWLADESNHEIRLRDVPGRDPWPVIYYHKYDGETLWGFSARVTFHLLETIGLKVSGSEINGRAF